MCMMTRHISYSSTMLHHAIFNDPHGNERIATILTPTNLKTQYLHPRTSWDSCINEGRIYRVPIFSPANELTYPGDNEYRQYFNDTAVLQRTISRHLIRKSRILINQGLSISSSRTIESHAQRTINHLYNKDCRTFILNHHYATAPSSSWTYSTRKEL